MVWDTQACTLRLSPENVHRMQQKLFFAAVISNFASLKGEPHRVSSPYGRSCPIIPVTSPAADMEGQQGISGRGLGLPVPGRIQMLLLDWMAPDVLL